MVHYQCQKCGKMTQTNGVPSIKKCEMGGNCVWGKMSRFIKTLFNF